MTPPMTNDLNPAELDHVYKSEDGKHWCVEGFFTHPKHYASINYADGWTGRYAIVQEYGNFSNEIRLVREEDFSGLYTLAWGPLKVCKFCGFSRMVPCETRGVCPSLGNMS